MNAHFQPRWVEVQTDSEQCQLGGLLGGGDVVAKSLLFLLS